MNDLALVEDVYRQRNTAERQADSSAAADVDEPRLEISPASAEREPTRVRDQDASSKPSAAVNHRHFSLHTTRCGLALTVRSTFGNAHRWCHRRVLASHRCGGPSAQFVDQPHIGLDRRFRWKRFSACD